MKLKLTNSKQPRINKPASAPADIRSLVIFSLVVAVGVFCLFGSKSLLAKALYQQKVLSAAHKSDKQLKANLAASSTLISQYNGLFENSDPANFLGGKNDKSPGAVPPNVDNARLALDALPAAYDYPALLASVTKILTDAGIDDPNILGTDQTSSVSSLPSDTPQPQLITISITGTGTSSAVQNVLTDLERSIRPFDVSNLELSGTQSKLSLNATLNTYFQPAKSLGLTQQGIK